MNCKLNLRTIFQFNLWLKHHIFGLKNIDLKNMIKYFFTMTLIFLSVSCMGSYPLDSLHSTSVNEKQVFLETDTDGCFCCINYENCSFQGQDYKAFANYLLGEIDSIKSNINSDKSTGLVIQFDIDKNGKVSNITFLERTEYYNFDTKVARIISESKGWVPAKAIGNPIVSRLNLIVEICNFKFKISVY
jgi:hypothetical protein